MSVLGASRVAMNPDPTSAVATQSQNSVLSQVATYIPSEVVATYVALQGIFSTGSASTASESTKWVLFGVGVALCVALPVLNFITTRQAAASAAEQAVPPAAEQAVPPAAEQAVPPAAEQAVPPAANGAAAPKWSKQFIVIVMAIVAFTAYAMALPSTVFDDLFKSANLGGAAAALVLAVLMPAIANAFQIKLSP
jgi:hypothetical protein